MILADASTGSAFLDHWGAICLLIVAVASALEIGRRTLKALVRLTTAVNAIYDLSLIAPDLQTIASEMSSNGGKSLKDSIIRVEQHVEKQTKTFEVLAAQVQENGTLITEMEQAQKSHLKLAHYPRPPAADKPA